jgi:hypothetical protein
MVAGGPGRMAEDLEHPRIGDANAVRIGIPEGLNRSDDAIVAHRYARGGGIVDQNGAGTVEWPDSITFGCGSRADQPGPTRPG